VSSDPLWILNSIYHKNFVFPTFPLYRNGHPSTAQNELISSFFVLCSIFCSFRLTKVSQECTYPSWCIQRLIEGAFFAWNGSWKMYNDCKLLFFSHIGIVPFSSLLSFLDELMRGFFLKNVAASITKLPEALMNSMCYIISSVKLTSEWLHHFIVWWRWDDDHCRKLPQFHYVLIMSLSSS